MLHLYIITIIYLTCTSNINQYRQDRLKCCPECVPQKNCPGSSFPAPAKKTETKTIPNNMNTLLKTMINNNNNNNKNNDKNNDNNNKDSTKFVNGIIASHHIINYEGETYLAAAGIVKIFVIYTIILFVLYGIGIVFLFKKSKPSKQKGLYQRISNTSSSTETDFSTDADNANDINENI